MDRAVELIEKWGDKLAELAVRVGPEVYELAMATLMINAAGNILTGVGMVIIGLFGLKFGLPMLKRATAENKKHILDQDIDAMFGGFFAGGIVCAISCLLIGLGLFEHILNVWNWAAFYDPRLVVAKRVLGL